jgi:hypothetical protein
MVVWSFCFLEKKRRASDSGYGLKGPTYAPVSECHSEYSKEFANFLTVRYIDSLNFGIKRKNFYLRCAVCQSSQPVVLVNIPVNASVFVYMKFGITYFISHG